MGELRELWGVRKTRTSPYYPQGNEVVERGNRTLRDVIRTLLLLRTPQNWEKLLPEVMRAFRATPRSVTKETANRLMLGQETRLPDQLKCSAPNEEPMNRCQYVIELMENLEYCNIDV